MDAPKLKTHDDVLAEQLRDPEVREQWERTALARAVALRILGYRVEHGLSQSKLARQLGMKQPAVARLESGEHNPSLESLYRLSQALEIEFLLDVAPPGRRPRLTPQGGHAPVVESFTTAAGNRVLVAID